MKRLSPARAPARSTRNASWHSLDVVYVVITTTAPAATDHEQRTMVRPSTLHRVFLQSLLSRRAMTDDTALVMLKRSLGAIRRESVSSSPGVFPPGLSHHHPALQTRGL